MSALQTRGASRVDSRRGTEKPSGPGAVQAKTGFVDKSRSYGAHHRFSFVSSFTRLLSTPLQTLMTSLVVAIALALPATLYLALNNAQQLGGAWDAGPSISVYLNSRAKPEAIDKFVARIEKFSEVKQVVYMSADQALLEFQAQSGFGETLSELAENPLPPTLIISPNAQATDPRILQDLGEKLRQEALVDEVSLDMEWVRRLREIMILGKKMVLALAGLLGLGVLLAIGNTIRLTIESRREEIIVTKLVGGTNGFVRRPFMYCGAWYGFFGGLLACIIVKLGFLGITGSVQRLADLYQSVFALQGLGTEGSAALLGVATILGILGAWLAVGRHLSKIEP